MEKALKVMTLLRVTTHFTVLYKGHRGPLQNQLLIFSGHLEAQF
jgi:hypothetical protein